MVERKVISEFHGEIEGVKFKRQELFETTSFVMGLLETIRKEFVDKELVRTFSEELYTLWIKEDWFSISDIESSICISNGKFEVGEGDYLKWFKKTNKLIAEKFERWEQLNA